jgi:diacylglycerol O-acyltransferase / wax synthase
MLMLFEPPADAPADFAQQIAERLRQSTQAASPFNRRLVRRRGLHYWVEDDEFDLAHHFVHMSLPKPGRIRELLAMVSRVHSGHLDRAYPLWRLYLVEGIEDGRIAIYMKIHHSLMDGITGVRMLMDMMAPTPEDSLKLPPPWEVKRRKSDAQALPIPTPAIGGVSALRALARDGVRSVTPLLRELKASFKDWRTKRPELALAGTAPRVVFNQKVSATRRFAAQSYATPRIRKVAEKFDATLNDVVLAMVSGALRRYLSDLGELPEDPLVTAVAVSTRRENSTKANDVGFTMVGLATHLADPADRLRAIRDGMNYNKRLLKTLSPGQYMAHSAALMMPGAASVLLGLSPKTALANLVVSHVPGPRVPMYWQGARLTGLYPASLVVDSGALNITLISRHDYVDFGLIACRKSVPHMQRLLDHLEVALAELEACA